MPDKTRVDGSDLRGLMHIVTDATLGITDLVEAMHNRIVHPPFLPSTPIQHLITGISGSVYHRIRSTTNFFGAVMEKTMVHWNPKFEIKLPPGKKERAIAVLNGVIGDYLLKSHNPLAIPMQLRYQGHPIPPKSDQIRKAFPRVSGKILLMVHGLCINDLQWNKNGHDHGELLAKQSGVTPIYLHYNSGLHISTNGQNMNTILDELLSRWPVAVEELVIIGHSMGGLVSRSAVYYGRIENKTWTRYLKKLIFLGSPHHGAPLEKIGNYLDHFFEAVHYLAPFARLGKMRSAGITDLRQGNLLEEDWNGKDRFQRNKKGRKHIDLPQSLTSYAMAACNGKEEDILKHRLLGDGLVHIESALGKHRDHDKALGFRKSNTEVVYQTSHLGLMWSPKVLETLKKWISE